MESSTYTDKKYIEASRNWVNVVAHSESGHEVDAIVGGKRVTVCDRYWNIPCSVHVDAYTQVGETFKGMSGVPCTVLASAEGKEIDRLPGAKSASELIKPMDKVFNATPGERINAVEWRTANRQMADGDAAFEKGEWKKANDFYTRVSKMTKKVLKDKGAEGLAKLDAKGAELVEEAKGKLESEKDEAKKALKKISDDFKGCPCAKAALDLLKEQK